MGRFPKARALFSLETIVLLSAPGTQHSGLSIAVQGHSLAFNTAVSIPEVCPEKWKSRLNHVMSCVLWNIFFKVADNVVRNNVH